jgi:GDP-D-mannose dehydratase
MFGKTGLLNGGRPLNENDVFRPMSPYASAKLYGYWDNVQIRCYI